MPELTRRQLLAGGLNGAAGARVLTGAAGVCVLTGAAGVCGLLGSPAALADTKPPPSDAELMGALVVVERQVLFVYGRALAAGVLQGRALSTAGELAAHERSHIARLELELPPLGASAPGDGPTSVAAANAALARHHVIVDLARDRVAKDWLKLLRDVEDVLERNYHLAISLLRHPGLIEVCAQIMASEAQHSALLATLRQRDIRKALPNAFVNGG